VPRALRDLGYDFAVAPEPDRDGRVVRTLGHDGGYALSVYPHVSGQSFAWAAEGWSSAQVVPAHLEAVLDILAALHCAPAGARADARTDDFAIPVRDVLERALTGAAGLDHGPFTRRAGRLVAEHADLLGERLARYDELAAAGRAQSSRYVLTHGEPHPGNTMLGPDGYLLIDWDTVVIAPPERDLWNFTTEMIERYTGRSGIGADPALLDLYRLRWNLTDIALYVAQFLAPHSGSANEAASWENLVETVGNLAATGR
jgi:spectinomycin phosphotransferase/16S rRNA (guanine(1405)-N(7))-methyltransferase